MIDNIADHWWLMLLRGIAATTFGVLVWFWPSATWIGLLTFYAAFCLAEGLLTLCIGIFGGKAHHIWWHMIVLGLLGLAAGAITISWSGITRSLLLVIIASWAIIRGVVEAVTALQLRKHVEGEWILAVDGLLSVLLGSALLTHPTLGPLSMLWMIAAFAVTTGILLILFSTKLHHLKSHPPGGTTKPESPLH